MADTISITSTPYALPHCRVTITGITEGDHLQVKAHRTFSSTDCAAPVSRNWQYSTTDELPLRGRRRLNTRMGSLRSTVLSTRVHRVFCDDIGNESHRYALHHGGLAKACFARTLVQPGSKHPLMRCGYFAVRKAATIAIEGGILGCTDPVYDSIS